MHHKRERSVALGTQDLLLCFNDINVLLAKLDELGVHRYVSAYGNRRHVAVTTTHVGAAMNFVKALIVLCSPVSTIQRRERDCILSRRI